MAKIYIVTNKRFLDASVNFSTKIFSWGIISLPVCMYVHMWIPFIVAWKDIISIDEESNNEQRAKRIVANYLQLTFEANVWNKNK